MQFLEQRFNWLPSGDKQITGCELIFTVQFFKKKNCKWYKRLFVIHYFVIRVYIVIHKAIFTFSYPDKFFRNNTNRTLLVWCRVATHNSFESVVYLNLYFISYTSENIFSSIRLILWDIPFVKHRDRSSQWKISRNL